MPKRTQMFAQFPWVGGVNTSVDESIVPPNELTKAQNLIFGVRGSRKKREGINFDWDDQSSGTDSIIRMADFWFGAASKTRYNFAINDAGVHYRYVFSTGARTTITDAGTAYPAAVTRACVLVFNHQAIICVDGTSNLVKMWDGTNNVIDLTGTPPQASIAREHLGRLWMNDKTNLDRLHYSTTGTAAEWNGVGDSGAIDIGTGDGDPEGITAIFPTFKGELFVAKKTKLYRISGYTPETFQVSLVSSGIGCVSHNSVAMVDQDDIVFSSERGFHSLAATAAYGDFEGAFLSAPIQQTFNDEFTKSRLKFIQAAYLNTINSVAFAVTDETVGTGANNCLWLFNFQSKSWYSWPNVSCESLLVADDTDQRRFYFGTSTNRIGKSFNGTNYDVTEAGASAAIPMDLASGIIYPTGDAQAVVGFKKFTLFYKPVGAHTITVSLKIDNFSPQTLTFSQSDTDDLLGTTFILGSSVLGASNIMAPQTQTFDGFGRGIKVRITQSGIDEQVEIQGFAVEFEPAGLRQEATH